MTPSSAPSRASSNARNSQDVKPQDRSESSSSSQQVLWELSRLRIQEQLNFQARLDQDVERRAERHKAALAASSAEHDRIREIAEAVRQQEELRLEIEKRDEQAREHRRVLELRKQREEQARAAEEETQQLKLEEDRQRREAEDREARIVEETRRRDEAAAAAKKKEEDERREAAEKAAERRKDIEERTRQKLQAAADSNKQAAPPQAAPPSEVPPPPLPPSQVAKSANKSTDSVLSQRKNAIHARYLEIHQNLKAFRKWLLQENKSSPDLKKAMQLSRQTFRSRLGGLTVQPRKNKIPMTKMREAFNEAIKCRHPEVDVTRFLLDPPQSSAATMVPAILIYMLNMFCKALLTQARNEASANPAMANAIGVAGATMLGDANWGWNGCPLTDILIARLHRDCPLLFGASGQTDTNEGRRQLGWKAGSEPAIFERQIRGTASLFAAMTLRKFSSATNLNPPYPQWHFWQAAATVSNTPSEDITDWHAYALHSMFGPNAERIIDLFGEPAMIMMRHVLVDFPDRFPKTKSVAAEKLRLIKFDLARDLMIQLD